MDLSLENLVLQRMPVGEVESPKRTSDGGGGWGYGGKQEGWGRVWKGVGITSKLKISPQICAPSKMSWRVNALVYP